jgi:hypothetical protein
MAVTAKFQADFSGFIEAIDKADVALVDMSKGASKVEASLNRMVDSFSGRKLIQEASLMTIAVEKAGGVAALTSKELEIVGNKANDAAEKLKKLGYEVPAGLQKLADQTSKTQTNTEALHTSLSRFDSLLNAVGLNISSDVRALGELGTASNQTVSSLGLLATAGLAAGTALGTYGLTRAFLQATGAAEPLDRAIANTTASLFGLGDVVAQTAAAQRDVLAKASAIAGREITSLSEAMRINAEEARKHGIALDTSASRIAIWQGEIDNVQKRGELTQLTEEIRSQAFSAAELENRFTISAGALRLLTAQMNDAEAGAKGLTAEVNKLFEAWAQGDKIMQDFTVKSHKIAMDAMREETTERQKMLAERNKTVLEGFNEIAKLQAENTDFVMKQTLSETDYKIAKIREWEQATIAAFKGTEQQLTAFTEAVRLRAQQEVDALTPVANIVTLIGTGTTSLLRPDTQGAIQAGPAGGTALSLPPFSLPPFSLPPFSLGGRAGGGPVSAGDAYWVGERGPELFRPNTSGAIIPNAGGGGPIVVQLIVDGRMLAEVVNDQTTRTLRQGRMLPSA